MAWLIYPNSIAGKDFKRFAQIRINALPSRKRVNRGRNGPTKCRACDVTSETLAHIVQYCPRTHEERLGRHDNVVKRLASGLSDRRYEIELERTFKLQDGNLKPDIVALKSDETRGHVSVICDVQDVSSKYAREWHMIKVRKYQRANGRGHANLAWHLGTGEYPEPSGAWAVESFPREPPYQGYAGYTLRLVFLQP